MEKIKVVVVGNCQARPLAKLLESLNPSIVVTVTAIVHLLKSEQFSEYQKYFEEADLIVSQLVLDSYPCDFVQTGFLKSRYKEKVVSIVNLYFNGYTPDWFYIRIPGRGALRGPMGDYHNRTIFEAWREGSSQDVAEKRLLSEEYNEIYKSELKKSLLALKERESKVDVKITDFLESKFRKERLFFTFNHPNMFLLREYAKRILSYSDIKVKGKWLPFRVKDVEMLDQFIPLANPSMGLPTLAGDLHKGVKFEFDSEDMIKIGRKKYYNSREIVETYFQIYEKLNESLNLKELVKS
ncbi:hypothetical protein G8770_02770 [Aestuariicella hydrocarbonica]|uniref:Polysaccharide biosynthesis enzyme WcbI domain-containing protein n=1 Tax=Pseudomaricurvus hydrocarbonicus TaxID=1470433 RepID=A0A9E5JPY2_9GAMM|nr:WcbI family polysaccharide biosynthesis putative acetyltransferase [Aestuariicella hydrocarbonica]NHO64467.1 hypothetical protein [Aestuariicella hydrocarbonica]